MEDEDKLSKSINRLERAIRRSNNLGWTILRGLFYSLGWVVGLGLIATIIIYILPKTGEDNVIGNFIRAMANALRQNR